MSFGHLDLKKLGFCALSLLLFSTKAMAAERPGVANLQPARDSSYRRIPNTLGQNLQSLNNRAGSTTIIDFASTSVLNILGQLGNSGTIILVSSNPNILSGTINAASILNHSGANISSVIPQGGLPGYDFLVSDFSFTLNATRSVVNHGSISSAGSLNISAGTEIVNQTLSGSIASMAAANNLNLNSMLGSITNSGQIASFSGNVNLLAAQNQNLIINNTGGLIQALQGSINVRDSLFSGKRNLALLGGDFLSQSLNLNAGCGISVLDAHDVSGVLNISAGESYVSVATPDLQVGKLVVSGDPTIYNALGDVLINTNLVFPGQPLAIVASGNIVTDIGAGKISTDSAASAGPIIMVAGALFSTSGASAKNPFAPVTLSISGPSGSGGKIDLVGLAPITQLSAQSTGKSGNGANLMMVAYRGKDSQSGEINLPTDLVIETGGAGKGKNGDVIVFADSAASLGDIDTSGGTGTGGNIVVRGAGTPDLLSGLTPRLAVPISFVIAKSALDAKTLNHDFSQLALIPQFSVNSLTGAGGDSYVDIAASSMQIGLIDNSGGNGSRNGGTVSLNSDQSMQVNPLRTNGAAFISIAAGSTGGNGGFLILRTGSPDTFAPPADLTLDNSSISMNVSNGSGSRLLIDLSGSVNLSPGNYDVSAAGGNFNAGFIGISGNIAGAISSDTVVFSANGSGTGNGGTVNLSGMPGTTIGFGTKPLNPGFIRINATGGSAGSAAGNGGSVNINSTDVKIDPLALNIGPMGNSGDGASLSINAKNIFISSSIALEGKGSGKGGTFEYRTFFSDPVQFGGSPANGVDGTVSVNGGGDGGIIRISSVGFASAPIILSSASSLSASPGANGKGGTIELTTKSDVQIPAGTISVNGSGNADGGNISISNLSVSTAGDLILSAMGAGSSGNGGKIVVGNAVGSFIPNGNLQINASGSGKGNGGSVIVSSDIVPLVLGTGNQQIQIKATSGLLGGNGGSLEINSKFPFLLDQVLADAYPKGQNGNGQKLSVQAPSILASSSNLSFEGAGNGDGGSVTFKSSNAFSIGTGAAGTNGIDGSILANSGPDGGSGGAINIETNNDITLSNWSNLQVAATSGNGGTISLKGGKLNLPSGSVNLSGTGTNSNGGTINLSTWGALAIASPKTLDLIADGKGIGNGGSVSVSSGSTLSIDSGAITVSARSGLNGGKGGSFAIGASSVTVNPSNLQLGPRGANGDGASVTITATDYHVLGDLEVNGKGTGSGGTIFLNDGASFAFPVNIGSVGSSGVDGKLSANGGSKGKGGSLTIFSSASNLSIEPAAISLSGTKGGSLSIISGGTTSFNAGQLSANGKNGDGGTMNFRFGQVDSSGPVIISVNGGGSKGNGGFISMRSDGTGTASLNLQANGSGSGNGGSIQVYGPQDGSDYVITPAKLTLSATGGSKGSSAGDAGEISIGMDVFFTMPGKILLDSNSINLKVLGSNGNGGKLSLSTSEIIPGFEGPSYFSDNIVQVTGSLDLQGKGKGSGGVFTVRYGKGEFIVGAPLGSSSGVTGDINTGLTGRINLFAPPDGSMIYSAVDLHGPGKITGVLNISSGTPFSAFTKALQGTGFIAINLPNTELLQLQTVLGSDVSIVANDLKILPPTIEGSFSGGMVDIQANSLQNSANIKAGYSVTITATKMSNQGIISTLSKALGSQILINTANMVNDGLISSSAGITPLTVQNTDDLTISGSGYLLGNPILLTSINGTVTALQNGYSVKPTVSPISGTATVNTPLSTSAALALLGIPPEPIISDGGGKSGLAIINTVNGAPSSTAIATDTIRFNVSLSDSEDDKGLAKVGDNKFVVTNTNQVLSLVVVGDNSMEFAEEGTEVSQEDGDTYLSKGKIVVNTTDNARTIRTPQGKVTIGKNSTAVVNVAVTGTLKTVALQGNGEFINTKTGSASVEFQKGDELIANDGGLDDEELIPVDGVERGETISAGLMKTGRTVVKRSISLKQIVDKDIMINGSLIHVSGARSKQHKAYVENVKAGAQSQTPFKPIAFVEVLTAAGGIVPSLPAPKPGLPNSKAMTIVAPTAKISTTTNNYLNLTDGNLFAHIKENSVMKTPLATIMVQKGAALNVFVDGVNKTVVLRVCAGVRSVQVLIGKHLASLSAGEELLISKGKVKDTDVYNGDGVGHRDSRSMHILGLSFAHSEFSIPSFLTSANHMTAVLHPQSSELKAARTQILKSAIAVQMVRGRKGPYTKKSVHFN